MPVMDGIEATREIRLLLSNQYSIARENQPKIIGITGHVLDKFREQGIDAGMDQVHSKPLNSKTLKKILDDYKY